MSVSDLKQVQERIPEPLAIRIETFSFSLGIQPKVEGVRIVYHPTGPSVIERRERASFLHSLNIHADGPVTIYPVDYQPLTGEETDVSTAEFPIDLCEDDPSSTNRDYRHPDPTDHGNQGVYEIPDCLVQIPAPKPGELSERTRTS